MKHFFDWIAGMFRNNRFPRELKNAAYRDEFLLMLMTLMNVILAIDMIIYGIARGIISSLVAGIYYFLLIAIRVQLLLSVEWVKPRRPERMALRIGLFLLLLTLVEDVVFVLRTNAGRIWERMPLWMVSMVAVLIVLNLGFNIRAFFRATFRRRSYTMQPVVDCVGMFCNIAGLMMPALVLVYRIMDEPYRVYRVMGTILMLMLTLLSLSLTIYSAKLMRSKRKATAESVGELLNESEEMMEE